MKSERKRDNTITGERLREIRKEMGLSQEQLGQETGYTQQNIGKMEQGKTDIAKSVLEYISRSDRGYNIEWLLGYSDDKYITQVIDRKINTTLKEADVYAEQLNEKLKSCPPYISVAYDLVASRNGGITYGANGHDGSPALVVDPVGLQVVFDPDGDELIEMLKDIAEYADFRLNQCKKRKENQ